LECPTDTTERTIETIDKYSTYCLNSSYCYFDTACTEFGSIEERGEFCQPAGTVIGEMCYYNPTSTIDCSSTGICEYNETWSQACDSGSANAGMCTIGNTCLNISCSPTIGWKSDSNPFPTTPCLSPNTLSCTQNGWICS